MNPDSIDKFFESCSSDMDEDYIQVKDEKLKDFIIHYNAILKEIEELERKYQNLYDLYKRLIDKHNRLADKYVIAINERNHYITTVDNLYRIIDELHNMKKGNNKIDEV